jgi:heme A synthase
MAQVLLAGTVGVVIATSPSWKRAPEHVPDYGWPSLRSLGALLPILVLTQVALGAAFRQRVFGLMPHIVGAILVSLVILIVCAFTLQQCPTHSALRAAAKTLMVLTFTQVFLGISAFTVRMMPNADAVPVLGFTGGHVTVGALTFAASVVLSMQIRRNMLPKSSAPDKPR